MDTPSLFDAPPAAGAPPRAAPAPAERPQRHAAAPPPTLLAIDGNSLVHRAWHAHGPSRGVDAALVGFLALLAGICDLAAPSGLVVGFDCRERSVRAERYPPYKAGRADKDAGLDHLLDYAPALLTDAGVVVSTAPGWEADDVVASAACAAEGAGWRCVVATSDRDAFALVSDATTVLRLRGGLAQAVRIDPTRLHRELRIRPGQYTEFAALRGDTSDNLPGVPGIGPARAAALLREYTSVAAAGDDPIGLRSVLGAVPGQALLDDLAAGDEGCFYRNVELMTPRRDLPIDVAATRPQATPAEVGRALAAWGIAGMDARMAVALAARPEEPPLPPEPPGS